MKFLYIFLITSTFLLAEDFITKLEYAKMLYQNPRGIGCNKCHGEKAEGTLISKYKSYDKKNKKYIENELRAPRINNLEFSKFRSALKESRGIMPSYFLTDLEIQNLYEYVKTFNKDK
ncbi:c-type cytochrome [Campylobacter hyointestinalis]|uniref:c-type cytochrome n=1 Tax=Campylobacter hyointestinalis TaxID=198 RepID=UPI0007C9321D|nr:c-type cytochrome [Campylobacter hyointestinalis]ANE33986.1 putative protein, possible cytochrome c [Campylobacter hyointestinalis subsp. lawsonii CCUG 27631]RAZ48194.1 cytochrome C oxidase subunit III [Campylobacter hyointestinalis subsp. lawsonii]RAZ49457.1 cytochrome C oxidase subunit III [Campylobacter hyointestinalis subsp. lawsonii]RAZ52327.1 cytochrome C oxidase subunit III [Campylobacter hyointestinalis subsp. lawsonii]RAZ60994.1 cytochrome C oxidase subunit III [Campylobacter hyoin